MHVLLTNDDGIDAPWLSALAAAFRARGDETSVLAPSSNQSGTSGALTPLPIGRQVELTLHAAGHVPADRAWGALGTTPSVCVLVGLAENGQRPVDLVVSGPNFGWNIGRDIWRSGTVWAAITAWGMGVPALAVSGAPLAYGPDDLDALTACALATADELIARPEPEAWNLNVPKPPSTSWSARRWTSAAPAERLTAAVVEEVDGSEGTRTIRISQHPDTTLAATPDSDAACVYGGGISLGRLRPLDAAR